MLKMTPKKSIPKNFFNTKKLTFGLIFSLILALLLIVSIFAEDFLSTYSFQNSLLKNEELLGEEKEIYEVSKTSEKSINDITNKEESDFKSLENFKEKTENINPLEDFFSFSQNNDSLIEIYNCQDLQNINNNLTDSYILMNNIDCSETINWNNGQGFEPIQSFSGLFDGNGYVISNLYINYENTNVGLFGSTTTQSEIMRVSLIETNISGIVRVGGLVGLNQGVILDSYSRGEISGINFIGGLVGSNRGEIYNSYSTCDIEGINFMGGLVGRNQGGKIINSFSTGNISGNIHIGGLVGILSGFNFRGVDIDALDESDKFLVESESLRSSTLETLSKKWVDKIINSAWHNHSGNPSNCYSGGNFECFAIFEEDHPPYFYNIENAPMNEWDFENIWSPINNGTNYPILRVSDIIEENIQIYNCQDLQNINNNLTDSYILMNNIDCSNTVNWNNGQGFEPIGNFNNRFNGTFNGNGKVISNLYINRQGSNYVGLFGFVFFEADLKNFGLVNGSITGGNYVGGIVGLNQGGRLEGIYSLSSVSGNEEVGLLIGSSGSSLGEVSNSYSIGNVTGIFYVGGLVGRNYGNILNSYSLGNIFGTSSSVGGLVGENRRIISDSYTVSNVSGTTIGIGSLVGNQPFLPLPPQIINSAWYNHSGNPDNCYFGGDQGCTSVSNEDHPPYFYNIENSPMNEWDFENIWSPINNGTNYPVLRWEVD